MSFAPTAFRQFACCGFGGRAASHFRGEAKQWNSPENTSRVQRGQVGTVVYRSPGGFCNTALTGVTRDGAGVALPACRVDLCQGNIISQSLISDGSGSYTFLNPGSGPFFIVAYKSGNPELAGTTVNTLQPAVV